MNAYDFLKEWTSSEPADEAWFYQLIKDFQQKYLEDENYSERVSYHRKPSDLKRALYTKLCDYAVAIQNRPEMRYTDAKTSTSGYVPSLIKEMWMEDKRLRSLYNVVQEYSRLENTDFILVAVHMAEYRAVNKLIGKMQRELANTRWPVQESNQDKAVAFTFNDWLENRFYNELTFSGAYVANDSENYLHLVAGEKLTLDELNKIQDAQMKAYDHMIEDSLRWNLRHFKRQTKESLDIARVVDIKIAEINGYFAANLSTYNDVLLPRLHRGIKIGAKFLLPEHYTASLEKTVSDVYNPRMSRYALNVEGKLLSFPTPDQMKYVLMEVQIRWLRVLTGYKARLQFEEMIAIRDFKMLTDNYGEGARLLAEYTQGVNFAADRELFITNRIKTYESLAPVFQSSIRVADGQNINGIRIHTGDFWRMGYTWVNNGYNAVQKDLEAITIQNANLCPGVPVESSYAVFVQVLNEVAAGGSIALHLAFLRDLLKNEATSGKGKITAGKCWLGNEAQREKLFEELSTESFVPGSDFDRRGFLNNSVIRWNQDFRALYYLLVQLKSKKYRMIAAHEKLGPVIRNNFVNKDGNPFRHVSQNINGMNSVNKAGKPRLSGQIDIVLKAAFTG